MATRLINLTHCSLCLLHGLTAWLGALIAQHQCFYVAASTSSSRCIFSEENDISCGARNHQTQCNRTVTPACGMRDLNCNLRDDIILMMRVPCLQRLRASRQIVQMNNGYFLGLVGKMLEGIYRSSSCLHISARFTLQKRHEPANAQAPPCPPTPFGHPQGAGGLCWGNGIVSSAYTVTVKWDCKPRVAHATIDVPIGQQSSVSWTSRNAGWYEELVPVKSFTRE